MKLADMLSGYLMRPQATPGPRERVQTWPAHWRELFEERAAIMEFDGGLRREDAEAKAFAELNLARESRAWQA